MPKMSVNSLKDQQPPMRRVHVVMTHDNRVVKTSKRNRKNPTKKTFGSVPSSAFATALQSKG